MKDMSPSRNSAIPARTCSPRQSYDSHPETQLDIGPPTDKGFYYDIDLDKKLDATTESIEAEMKKVIKKTKSLNASRPREEAVEKIQSIGQERYKLGRLDDILEGEQVSFIKTGSSSTSAPDHTSATPRRSKPSSSSRVPTTEATRTTSSSRIYGTAFPTRTNWQSISTSSNKPKRAITANSAKSSASPSITKARPHPLKPAGASSAKH